MPRAVTERAARKIREQMGIRGGRQTYVTQSTIETTRARAPAKHWAVDEWLRLLVEMQEQGEMRIAKHARTGTPAGKQAVKARGTERGPRERTKEVVRKWLQKEAGTSATGKYIVTAGQAKRATDVLHSKGKTQETTRTAMAVTATLVIMASEGEVELQLSSIGKGGSTRDPKAEVRTFLEEQQWATPSEAARMVESVQVTDHKANTIIELGSGWRGATDGMESAAGVQRVVTRDCAACNLGKRGTVFPEVWGKFQKEKKGQLVEATARKAGVSMDSIIGVWMSLSCKPHSTANGLGKNAGTGKGTHAGKEMDPEEAEGMEAGVVGVHEWHLRDPTKNQYFMENVGWGSLRSETLVRERMGEGKMTNGCAYGTKHQKPYRYWTSIPEAIWTPRLSQDHCKACKQRPPGRHEQTMCPQQGDSRPRPKIPGYTNEAARNRVPPALATEVAKAFAQMREVGELQAARSASA